MTAVRIKPVLKDVLSNYKNQRFTVGELTQRYLDHPDCTHSSQKAARQFVYRNLLRLIDIDGIQRFTDDQWPTYLLTKDLDAIGKTSTQTNKTEKIPIRPTDRLKDRLRQHRSDMLCAIGEAEEYSALCDEMPSLKTETQALYNQARERSAKILGKIRALESLLSVDNQQL